MFQAPPKVRRNFEHQSIICSLHILLDGWLNFFCVMMMEPGEITEAWMEHSCQKNQSKQKSRIYTFCAILHTISFLNCQHELSFRWNYVAIRAPRSLSPAFSTYSTSFRIQQRNVYWLIFHLLELSRTKESSIFIAPSSICHLNRKLLLPSFRCEWDEEGLDENNDVWYWSYRSESRPLSSCFMYHANFRSDFFETIAAKFDVTFVIRRAAL